jgi:beta-xylosidase
MFLFFAFAAALLLCGHALAIKNSIISGWNPDPATLRVGSDYYIAMPSSSIFREQKEQEQAA